MIKRVVITSVILYVLGSIQSEEKKRRSEGEKNCFTFITTSYTQLWGFWEPKLWESKANINKNTPALWTTEPLPMLYSYMLFTHTYLNLCVQCVVDLLRPPCSTFFVFFSVQPFLKRCLMPHWRFFNLQTSNWAESQHPSVCLYSIFPSLLWENSLVSLSVKPSSQPGWVFNPVCSFIPPSSMYKLLSGRAEDIILQLLCSSFSLYVPLLLFSLF